MIKIHYSLTNRYNLNCILFIIRQQKGLIKLLYLKKKLKNGEKT